MIAKGLFIQNEHEIEQANALGMDIPDPIFIELEICFDVKQIEVAFVSIENKIIVFFKSAGRFELAYKKELFENIINSLK